MATEGPFLADGAQTTAAADLSSNQFYAVKLTGARQVNLASAGGEDIYGVLQNKPTSGQVADVALYGICKAVAGAAFSAGAQLMTDTSGRLIAATSTNHRVASALEAATQAGQIVTVFLRPIGTVT
ncbi:MAG TPA: capsid cement protein [Stellaceae bacterium]|nr:capsid cement protein [Stellaceae bacterium]